MVKVIIEEDSGTRRGLSGDFAFVTVASDKESGYEINNCALGKFDRNQIPHFLAHTVFDNLNTIYKDETPTKRIFRLVEFESYMEALVMGEITENKDALDLPDEANFMLDFIKRMKEEENNGN